MTEEAAVRPIGEETREAIWSRAQEREQHGETVSRRALARELGVSPQTVARVLDGPNARRSGPLEANGESVAGLLVGLGLLGLATWAAHTVAKKPRRDNARRTPRDQRRGT